MKISNNSDTKSKLLQSALTLFEKNGYWGTSVNDIINKAELTKGSFYHYFQSKEDLLYLIHEVFVENELHKAKKIFNNETLTNKEKLRELLCLIWDSLDKYKENFTVFFGEFKYIKDDEKFQKIREKRDEFASLFNRVLEDGIEAGEFKPTIDTKLITFGINGIAAWGIQWYRQDGPNSVKEISQKYTDMIFDGIAN